LKEKKNLDADMHIWKVVFEKKIGCRHAYLESSL